MSRNITVVSAQTTLLDETLPSVSAKPTRKGHIKSAMFKIKSKLHRSNVPKSMANPGDAPVAATNDHSGRKGLRGILGSIIHPRAVSGQSDDTKKDSKFTRLSDSPSAAQQTAETTISTGLRRATDITIATNSQSDKHATVDESKPSPTKVSSRIPECHNPVDQAAVATILAGCQDEKDTKEAHGAVAHGRNLLRERITRLRAEYNNGRITKTEWKAVARELKSFGATMLGVNKEGYLASGIRKLTKLADAMTPNANTTAPFNQFRSRRTFRIASKTVTRKTTSAVHKAQLRGHRQMGQVLHQQRWKAQHDDFVAAHRNDNAEPMQNIAEFPASIKNVSEKINSDAASEVVFVGRQHAVHGQIISRTSSMDSFFSTTNGVSLFVTAPANDHTTELSDVSLTQSSSVIECSSLGSAPASPTVSQLDALSAHSSNVEQPSAEKVPASPIPSHFDAILSPSAIAQRKNTKIRPASSIVSSPATCSTHCSLQKRLNAEIVPASPVASAPNTASEHGTVIHYAAPDNSEEGEVDALATPLAVVRKSNFGFNDAANNINGVDEEPPQPLSPTSSIDGTVPEPSQMVEKAGEDHQWWDLLSSLSSDSSDSEEHGEEEEDHDDEDEDEDDAEAGGQDGLLDFKLEAEPELPAEKGREAQLEEIWDASWKPLDDILGLTILQVTQAAFGSDHGDECYFFRECTNGAYNRVHFITFDDGFKCVLRIPRWGVPGSWNDEHAYGLRTTVATMRLIQHKTKIPIPRIYDWSDHCNNLLGHPYIITDFMEGVTLSKFWGPKVEETVEMLHARRAQLVRSVAKVMAQLGEFTLPSVCAISELDLGFHFDGSNPLAALMNGPIVQNIRVGGYYGFDEGDRESLDPVDVELRFRPRACTAAMDGNAEQMWNSALRRWMSRMAPLGPEENGFVRIMTILIDNLPKNMVSQDVDVDEEFTFFHDDLNMENILVDDNGEVSAILDWDWLHTERVYLGACRHPKFLTPDYMHPEWNWQGVHQESTPDWAVYRRIYSSAMATALRGEGHCRFTAKSPLFVAMDRALNGYGDHMEFLERVLRHILPGDVRAFVRMVGQLVGVAGTGNWEGQAREMFENNVRELFSCSPGVDEKFPEI